jgi:hypothetical protein
MTKKKPTKIPLIKKHIGITPELSRAICHYVKMGAWIETAAYAAGVSPTQVKAWMKRGFKGQQILAKDEKIEQSEVVYVDFLTAIQQATAKAELIDLHRINAAGKAGDWKATAWKMERCSLYKDRWKTDHKLKHEHTGKDGKPIQHLHGVVEIPADALPIEVCEKILEKLQLTQNTAVSVDDDILPLLPNGVFLDEEV